MLVEFAGSVLSTMLINYPNKVPNVEQRYAAVFVTAQPSEPYGLFPNLKQRSWAFVAKKELIIPGLQPTPSAWQCKIDQMNPVGVVITLAWLK